MKLGNFERAYILSPVRRYLHQPWMLRRLLCAHPLPQTGAVLEIGCATGNGLRLLQRQIAPERLHGLEYDTALLQVAQAKFPTLPLVQGDAAALPYPNASFAAVFDFGVIHHVPQWQQAVAEIARVLAPGGVCYLEEYYQRLLHNRLFQALAPHPPQRFCHADLLAECTNHGLDIVRHHHLLNLTGYVVAHKKCPRP